LLWAPVAFGLGAAAYLGLPDEPALPLALIATLPVVVLALAARLLTVNRALLAASGLLATVACGFLVAKVHSDRLARPVIPAGFGAVEVQGWVVDIEAPSERGARLLIAPTRIDRLAPQATPNRVRLVTPLAGGPELTPPPGSAIKVFALLNPPPGPASPGAYDFARDAWFEQIGGVGLALKPPVETVLDPPPWRLRVQLAVNALRWSIAESLARNIAAALGKGGEQAAGLAVAVTTSHQDWLSDADRDNLRGSGLAHMLAIAGLHTAAVTGFAFFACRLAIAAWPWLALRVPGKKVAAVVGLLATASYLLLSGAHPPARRAAITAAVAFVAILLDRRPVSLHSLAMAALIILVGEPEVVLAPGFEMSFCATASLVALAQIWPRRETGGDLPWVLRSLQKVRDAMVGLAMVSLVAGAATGPFTIQHFNRVANYGVFANLTADFVASAILMPALALCLAVQAVGAAPWFPAVFWTAGWAARAVLWLGRLFANAPGALLTMSPAPQIALAISYLGIIFACLWQGRLRWIGLPMAAAVALWPRPPAPAAWIASDGDDAAVSWEGQAIALKATARAYALGQWAQRRTLVLPSDPVAAQRAHFDCDRSGCAPLGRMRPAIAAWWTKRPPPTGRWRSLCDGVDVLILRAAVSPPASCRGAIILRRSDFVLGGAAEVYANGRGWRLDWAQPRRGRRPWSINGSGG
jgi:competence protein ComEC